MTTTRLAQLVRDNPGPAFCLLLFAAVLAANAPVVAGLGKTWWISYSEMGHGFLAPPLALYIAWLKKDHLRELPVASAPAGLFLTISAMLLILVSHLAQWIFFSQIGLWLLLVGAIWYLLGWQWLKALRFPIFLLALAIPPPSFLYTRVTFEMQLLASRMGEMGLEGLGYSVLREGNILHLPGERLSVAEACSGIRSLVTLVFFVTVYGYFMVANNRNRMLLILSAVPVAVLANGLRIVATGVLSQYNRALAQGFTHELSGYLTLIAGGAICILLEQSLSRNSQIQRA